MSTPTIRKIMYGILILGFIIMMIAVVIPEKYNLNIIFQLIGYFIFICGLIFSLIFYRCPGCHGLLHSRGFFPPEYCSRCGEELD